MELRMILILCILWTLLNSGVTQLTLSGPTVSYAGGRATFTCSNGENTVSVQWLVNGKLLNSSNMNIISEFSQITRVGNLLFRDVLQYNRTTIQCSATSSSGRITHSNVITMLVQGRLSAVGDLSATVLGSTISLTWNSPFTLDITNVDPDITYRVDVINSTSSQVIHSQGGITITQYNYTTSLSPERRACDVFKFTITPFNRVGSGNVSTTSQYYSSHAPSVLSHVTNLISSCILRMSAMVCRVDVMGISILNYTDEEIDIEDIIVTINDSDHTIIEVASPSLKLNRHYNITLNISNSAGSSTEYITLSTHDVQRVHVVNSTVNVFYVEKTRAKGALCISISVYDRGMNLISSVFIFIPKRNESHISMLYLSPGKYDVVCYDVESNGRLPPGIGYPAYIQRINITQTGSILVPTSPHLENCDVSHSNGNILASCEFPSTSMASGFQIILQFNDPANVESVHRLMVGQTLNHNTSVSISVNRSGTYHATIFAILNETILDEFPSYSMGFTVNVQGTNQGGTEIHSIIIDGTETTSPIAGSDTIDMPKVIAIAVPVIAVVVVVVVLTTIIIFAIVAVRRLKKTTV